MSSQFLSTYTCDRCEARSAEADEFRGPPGWLCVKGHFDLCPACFGDLRKWVKT